ncbi:MAG: TIR domain-containing protein [Caulobacteraceae bacterium]
MPDVFISYARSTEGEARAIGEALRSLGHGVWRDDEIPAHRTYAEVIEERLRAAKAVVVIWSAEAVRSQWVRAEAEVAREAGTLVQLRLDSASPPLPFNQIQCADLSGWSGDADHPGWRKIAASVADLVGAAATGPAGAAVAAPLVHKLSVCVLPFANMSGDAEQEYFSDGISEDIITDLSKVSALSVVARNTAFTFKGKAVRVNDVARELNVSHVLEGSVRKAGGRVRISAQLIDGATGDHLWAERFDRDLDDIFALQDEISQAIVAALRLKLLPEEKRAIERRGTDSAEAYDLYLMARQYWVSGNFGDSRREEAVIRLCRRATEIDRSYARAWALMGRAQADLKFRHGQREIDSGEAAEMALSLDPNLAEAHALKAAQLRNEGRLDEASDAVETALRLDAESYEVCRIAAVVKFGQHRLAEAIPHFESAAALMVTDFNSPAMLVTCYVALGNAKAAQRTAQLCLSRCEIALAKDPGNGAALGSGACMLAVLKEAERANDWVRRALLVDPDNQNMRYNLACGLSRYLGDIAGALDLIGPWCERTSAPWLEHAKVDPDLDPIRDDPRFRAMIAAAEARLAAAEATATA